MNREQLRQLFVDVDTPVAEQLLEALQRMERAFSAELCDEASLACHRLRGDARTVGFEVVAQLVGVIEDQLSVALKEAVRLEPDALSGMAVGAEEIIRRMKTGVDGCAEPLSSEWLSWVDAQRLA